MSNMKVRVMKYLHLNLVHHALGIDSPNSWSSEKGNILGESTEFKY